MGYNAGLGLVDDFSWLAYVINTDAVQQLYDAQQEAKIDHATDYAIRIKQDAGLLLRTYVLEAQNAQNQWVCFRYNESDKLSDVSWQTARDDATRQVDCLTGN